MSSEKTKREENDDDVKGQKENLKGRGHRQKTENGLLVHSTAALGAETGRRKLIHVQTLFIIGNSDGQVSGTSNAYTHYLLQRKLSVLSLKCGQK